MGCCSCKLYTDDHGKNSYLIYSLNSLSKRCG